MSYVKGWLILIQGGLELGFINVFIDIRIQYWKLS